jgi:hypothetical protein
MKIYCILLLLVFTHVCGCFIQVHKREKRAFTAHNWCYDHQSANQATGKLRYDGYYSKSPNFLCIFYSDGFWVAGDLKDPTVPKEMTAVNPYGIYKWGCPLPHERNH